MLLMVHMPLWPGQLCSLPRQTLCASRTGLSTLWSVMLKGAWVQRGGTWRECPRATRPAVPGEECPATPGIHGEFPDTAQDHTAFGR